MSNEGIVIYRLKNGNTPNTYGIRHYNVMIETDEGLKEIGYYLGGSSIFANDNKKREKQRIVFEFNGADATEFIANKSDIILNKYLQNHPDFNKQFEIYSKELQSEKDLAKFEKVEKALEKINESDSVKIKAMALAIFGMDAYAISEVTAKAKLKEAAHREPDVILLKMDHPNYQYHFLSAHAFFGGVVKENEHKNAVVWNDETQGTILHLATGETGIYQLAEMLSSNDNDARKINQSIGERLMKKASASEGKEVVIIDNSAEKDAEIEKLKAQIAEMSKEKANSTPVVNAEIVSPGSEEIIEPNTKKEEIEGNGKSEEEKAADELKSLHEQYNTKFKKPVPTPFKNQVEWIKTQLAK